MAVPIEKPDGSTITTPLLEGASAPDFVNFESYPNSTEESGPTLDTEKEHLHFDNW